MYNLTINMIYSEIDRRLYYLTINMIYSEIDSCERYGSLLIYAPWYLISKLAAVHFEFLHFQHILKYNFIKI